MQNWNENNILHTKQYRLLKSPSLELDLLHPLTMSLVSIRSQSCPCFLRHLVLSFHTLLDICLNIMFAASIILFQYVLHY